MFDRDAIRRMRHGLVVLLLAARGSSPLDAAEKGSQQVSPFAGSYSQAVAIQVPSYHGLEPRLSLGYSSEGRNGFVGVGWGLSGFSTIERTNAGRGSPRFDSSDAFVLDGQELLPCAGLVSPGCQAGGTHATKIESFLRIVRDTPNDAWTVYGRDGTKTTFGALVGTSFGTLRWGQTSVVDTKGNAVTYNWACPAVSGATGDCYPDWVEYNGYRVTLFREARPDTLSFPAVSNMGVTLSRLRSVVVQRLTPTLHTIRAYRLSYTTSGVTGRSLLSSVQQFGKTATVDGSGAITGADALPAQTFTYQQDGDGKKFLGPASSGASSPSELSVSWATADGTAKAGSDYTGAAGSLTFTGSETTKTFSVDVIGDTAPEHNETFLVNLSGAVGGSVGRAQGQATILNDDGSPASVSVSPVCLTSGNVTVSVSNGPANAGDLVKVYATGAADSGDLDWWYLNGARTAPASGSSGGSFQAPIPSAPGTYEFRFFSAAGERLDTSNVVTVGACAGTPSASIGDVAVNEGDAGTTTANLTVSLSSASTQTVTLSWATADGSAAAGSDYQAGSGTLTFAPGETVKTVGVSVNGDAVQESHETFFVNLSNPVNASLGDSQGQATILNDDGGTASLAASLACVSPGAAVVVSFAGAPGHTSDWVGIYPTASTDYVNWWSLSGSQSWPSAPLTSGSFTAGVPATPGTYALKLNDGTTGAVVATSGVVTVGACTPSLSIGDVSLVEGHSGTTDAHFTITLSAPASQVVSVSYATAGGTAAQGVDFIGASGAVTLFTGETSKTVAVAVVGDTTAEADETFFVNLGDAVNATISDGQGQATITNDDGVATVVAAGCGAPGGTTTVRVGGGPGQPGDWVGVYPAAGGGYLDWWYLNGTKTMPASGSADAAFAVTLPGSAGGYVFKLIGYATGQAVATSPPLTVGTCAASLSIGDVQVVEGDSGPKLATFTVSLQPASAQLVTVDYAAVAGTAAAGDDFEAVADTLTFNPGETSKTLAVAVIGDALQESAETFLVRLRNATNAVIARGQATGTIVDDDGASFLKAAPVSVAGGGSVTVRAEGGPGNSGDWIGLYPASGGGYVDWWYMNGTQSAPSSPLSSAQFSAAMPAAAGSYELRLIDGATGAVAQKSTPVCVGACLPLLSIADATVVEGTSGAAAARFRLSLAAPSSQSVSVSYETADATATAGSDYVQASGTLVFAAGETSKVLSVDVNGDAVPEPNERFLVNLSGAQGATLANPQAQAHVVNDDGPGSAVGATPGCVASAGSAVVTVIGGGGNAGDWVGVFATGSSDSSYLDWWYLSGTRTAPALPLSNTSFGVTMPAAAGSYELRLFNSASGLLIGASPPVTVGACSAVPALSIGDVTVTEGDQGTTNALFTVSLSSGTAQTVTVDYSTSSGTAEQGSDFIAASGTLTFNGETTKVVAVKVLGDMQVEPSESFFVSLSSPANATLARAQGIGTISNDDGGYEMLAALPTCVSGGGGVRVSVSAGPGQAGDWVGLFPAGASNSGALDWWYLNGTRTMPGAGMPSAAFDVTMPATQGTYELRLFGYGSEYRASSAPIDVGGCSSLSIGDVQVTEGDSGTTAVSFTVTRSVATADTPALEATCGADQLLLGDFNGDGRTDQACYQGAGGGKVRVLLGTASGFAPPETWLQGVLGQPLTGDYDNDGRTDLASFDAATGEIRVALSTGSVFKTPASWGGTGSCTGPVQLGGGDFNGDGYPDVSCKNVTQASVVVGLSNGAGGFTFSDFGNVQCDAGGERTGALDFDGDGKDDWYCIGVGSGALTVFRNFGGTQFVGGELIGLPASFCAAEGYVFADLNGDGRTDVSCIGNGKVALSTGYEFREQGGYGGWCPGSTHFFAGDFDGDGASEIVCDNLGSGPDDVQVRKWSAGALQPAETWKDSFCGGSFLGGDFNGDGKTDLYCASQASPVAYAGTAGVQPDLLAASANGLGGTVAVAYTPSTAFPSVNNPPPKYAVTSLVTDDGRGLPDSVATTRYAYSGGRMDRKQRRFLGFRYMKESRPCLPGEAACPVAHTYLKQDSLASAGKPERIEQRDSAGRILSAQAFEYQTTAAEPLRSQLSAAWSYAYDGTTAGCAAWPCGSGRRSLTTTAYDGYGNVTETASHGDYDAGGDETTTLSAYVPNASLYIVDRVSSSRTLAGVGGGGTKLQETRLSYDGLGFGQAPVAGYPTTTERWLSAADRFVASHFVYDGFGNATQATDETGVVAVTTWDADRHLFPVQVENASGDKTTTLWDDVCGAPLSTQAPNQQGTSFATTYQTDGLCRPSLTTDALGGFEARSYLGLGDPNAQQVRIETPSGADDGTGNAFSRSFFDGLGRTYRTETKAAAAGVTVLAEQSFNRRGGVAASSAPRFSNQPPQQTSYAYDGFDRLTETLLPDGHTRRVGYGLLSQTTTDENGKQATSRRDPATPLEAIQERFLGGQPVRTSSSYDLLGRLVGMADDLGHAWSWDFDSLGRNIQKTDPDAGTWSFGYDDAGRLLSQTDAKGQTTTFAYDSAGRLTTRTNAAGTVTTAYGDARPGFFNAGFPTTVATTGTTVTTLKLDYDQLGRAVKQTRSLDGLDYVLARTYDSAGFLRGLTYPDGDSLTGFTYDAAGRLSSVPGILSSVSYDAAGRPLVQTNANGTLTTRSYSPTRGFLTGIQTFSGPALIQDLVYALDPAGLVTSVTSPVANEAWSYQYDDLYRLTQATNLGDGAQTQTWSYDSIGRITFNSRVGSYSYPGVGQPRPHAPTTAGGNSYSYDPNGNLTAGAGRTPVWDADNRIASVSAGSATVSFGYDEAGERVKKTTATSTSLYPLGDDYEVANGVVTKYVSVEGLGVIAKRVGPVGSIATFWLHTDRLGSLNATTDAAGAEVLRRNYRPYGETLAQTGSHTESRGWIDQRNDAETGLTYLHARYYDPAIGTFLSPDPMHPLRPGVGLNRYGYAWGNPIVGTDRSGLRMPCGLNFLGYSERTSQSVTFNGVEYRTTHLDANYSYDCAEFDNGPFGETRRSELLDRLRGPVSRNPGTDETNAAPGAGGTPGTGGTTSPAGGSSEGGPSTSGQGEAIIPVLKQILEFFLGTGNTYNFYGPDNPMTQQMMNAPGVNYWRNVFRAGDFERLENQAAEWGLFQGDVDWPFFGYDGAFSSNNLTRQVQGGYTVSIYRRPDGGRDFLLTNPMSLHSGGLHFLPSIERAFVLPPLSPAFGTTYHYFYWSEPKP